MYHHGYCCDFYFVFEQRLHRFASASLIVQHLPELTADGDIAPPRSSHWPMRPISCAMCILPAQHAERFLCPLLPELKPMLSVEHPLLGAINSRELATDSRSSKARKATEPQDLDDIDAVSLQEVNDEVLQRCSGRHVDVLEFAPDTTFVRRGGPLAYDVVVLEPPFPLMGIAQCSGLVRIVGEWPSEQQVSECHVVGEACAEDGALTISDNDGDTLAEVADAPEVQGPELGESFAELDERQLAGDEEDGWNDGSQEHGEEECEEVPAEEADESGGEAMSAPAGLEDGANEGDGGDAEEQWDEKETEEVVLNVDDEPEVEVAQVEEPFPKRRKRQPDGRGTSAAVMPQTGRPAAQQEGSTVGLLNMLVQTSPKRFPQGPPQFAFKEHSQGLWCCTASVSTARGVLSATGTGASKSVAKQLSAQGLLRQL